MYDNITKVTLAAPLVTETRIEHVLPLNCSVEKNLKSLQNEDRVQKRT